MSESINQTDNLFKQIVESSPVYLWAADETGVPTYYNKDFREFLGIKPAGDIKNWQQTVHPDDIENTLKTFYEALAKQTAYSLECRLLRADGQWRSTLTQGKPIFNSDDKFLGFVGSTVDVTEVKQTNEAIRDSESKLNFAIDAAELCVWDYNPLTKKFNANKPMREWYGLGDEADLDLELGLATIANFDRDRVAHALQKALTWGEGDYNIEYTLINPITKQQRIVCAKGKATFGEDKIAYRIDGILQDVTVQALATKELQESKEHFQNLVRDADAAIVVLTGLEMKVEVVNDAYGRLINLTPQDLTGKPLFSVVPEAEAYYMPVLEKVMTTGEKLQLYNSPYAVSVNGELVEGFLHATYQPYKNAFGEVIGVMAIMQDVTEAEVARKKLEKSEKKFEAAIAAVEGHIWTNNALGEMEGEQPGWAALTGQTYEQYKGYGWANVVHPDDAAATIEAWNTAVKNKKIFEFEHRINTTNKGWRMFATRAVPSFDEAGNIEQWVGVHTDITEQKEAVLKIQESEERIRTLIYSSPSAISILEGPELVIKIANDSMIRIWSKGKDVVGKKYFELLPELVDQGLKEVFYNVYTTGNPYYAYEAPYTLYENDKPVLGYFNFILYPQRNLNNEVTGVGIIATEVTDQTIINNKVKESELQFNTLANNIQNLAWIADSDGSRYWYNDQWYAYTGTTFDEVKAFGWKKVQHPDYIDDVVKFLTAAFKKNQPWSLTYPLRGKNGTYKRFLTRATPICDAEGKILRWIGTNTDVEEQQSFSEKLEAEVNERTWQLHKANNGLKDNIEELAKINKELAAFSYVASHDLQEPLRKIQTFVSILKENEKETLSESGKKYLNSTQLAASRMQNLIKDLLSFSGMVVTEGQFETTDLNEIVKELIQEFEFIIIEKNATIEVSHMVNLKVIPFQFKQVLHNLISNALKFTKPDIDPQIKIESKIAKGSDLQYEKLLPNLVYAKISVADNGIGFSSQYSERVFEVFQRLHKKEEYEGTGIGLAIVKKVIDNHRGFIHVDSEPERGSVFNLYVPV